MNNERQNAASSKDELIKTKTGDIELAEPELGEVSGGIDWGDLKINATKEG